MKPLYQLDANVILRLILQDDPIQSAEAGTVFQMAENGEFNLVVSSLTVAEVIWVLESRYGLNRGQIQIGLSHLLSRKGFMEPERARIQRALVLYQSYGIDFADAALVVEAISGKADSIITFDSDFDSLPVRVVHPREMRQG